MKAAIIATILVCAGLIGLGVYYGTRPESADSGPRTTPLSQAYTDRTSSGYWAQGAKDPKVTVVEYADFQCPYCAVLAQPLSDAIAQSSDYVQLQYHMYPLSQHNKAKLAAYAAESAGRQGKFWEMHDKIYSTQNDWSEQIPSDFQSTVEAYATSLGLDLPQFKRDMKDASLQTAINADMAAGDKVPVEGTPTLIVNGTVLKTVPYKTEDLLAVFQNARDGKPVQ